VPRPKFSPILPQKRPQSKEKFCRRRKSYAPPGRFHVASPRAALEPKSRIISGREMATTAARTLFSSCSLAPALTCSTQSGHFLVQSSSRIASLSVRPGLRAVEMGGTYRVHNIYERQTRSITSTSRLRSSRKFTYNVAASYIAKGLPYDPATHVFHFNPHNRVQAPKGKGKAGRPESGQDAFFVSRVGESPSSVALGVADGVGGWMESGVDPADFSHAFCAYMAASATSARGASKTRGAPLTPRQVMQEGYEAVCHDRSIKAGGSTAVVGLFDEDGTLEVANLGDSGFILLRLNAVHAASDPQTHAFNTPFQLSVVPPSVLLRAAAFGGAQLMDQPRDAEVTRHELRHGDVILFASDGLWDNLFNQDILHIVCQAMSKTGAWLSTEDGTRVVEDLTPYTQPDSSSPSLTPGAVAEAAPETSEADTVTNARPKSPPTLQSLIAAQIVNAAKAASLNAKLNGPFSKEVKKYYPNERWQGGKEDDICVVAVVVSEGASPPKPRL
jgi:protein phosphatase PTC7